MSMSGEQLLAINQIEAVLTNSFLLKHDIRQTLKATNTSLYHIRSLWPTMPELQEPQSQTMKKTLAICCWQYTIALKHFDKLVDYLWTQIGYELAFSDEDLADIGYDFDGNVQWAEDVWVLEDLGAIRLADQTMVFIG